MKSILSTLFCFMTVLAFAQNDTPLKNNNIYKLKKEIKSDSRDFDILQTLGLDSNHKLTKVSSITDKYGSSHIKYSQSFKGYKIVGATAITHESKGMIQSVTGDLFYENDINLLPSISENQAESIAYGNIKGLLLSNHDHGQSIKRHYINLPTKRPDIKNMELVIVKSKPNLKNSAFVLAYEIVFETKDQIPFRYKTYVNAQTGKYLFGHSLIAHSNIEGKGDGYYYKDVSFRVDSLGLDNYVLRDDSRGQGVFGNDSGKNGELGSDEDNIWNSNQASKQSLIDAYYGAQVYYDYMQTYFNRNSLDDQGFPLTVNANNKLFVNAFWDGQAATFGAGDCDFANPFTTFEIVSHEFTHGFTEFTSGLIYFYESGALNEGFSDIFGKGMEFYYENDQFNWKIGKRIFKSSDEDVIRSMSDPNEEGDPKTYEGVNWVPETGFDNGGVHSNSGVLNHWFYLLVEGGNGINEAGQQYSVSPISMQEALDICYQMEVAYLTPNSGFREAYEFSLEIASNIYGEGTEQYNSIQEAWKAVGIDDSTFSTTEAFNLVQLYNGKLQNEGEYCPSEFNELNLSIFNNGFEAIPAGTEIDIITLMSYSVLVNQSQQLFNETAFYNSVLSEDWLPGATLDYVLTHDFPEGYPDEITFTSNIDIEGSLVNDGQISIEENLDINSNTVAELGFTFFQPSNPCNAAEGFNFMTVPVNIPQCEDLSSSSLVFTLDNGLEVQTNTINLPEDDETFNLNYFNLESMMGGPVDMDLTTATLLIEYQGSAVLLQ